MIPPLLKTFLLAALLAPTLVFGTSSSAQAGPAADLVLTLTSTSEPVTGTKVTFTGTAPKSLAGVTAALKRRVGKDGEWIKVGGGTIGTDGTFSVAGTATGVGSNSWRVVAKRAGVLHQSAIVKTKVFAWYALTDSDMVDQEGFEEGSATIGGQNYAKSAYTSSYYDGDRGDTVWAEYNLSYRCKTLESYIGVSDSSESGFAAGFAVYLDGAQSDLGQKGLGSATKITLDTATRLRVRLEVQPGNGIPDSGIAGRGVYGNPKVLCSGRP